MKRFAGKNVLITGGSAGIGLESARQFAYEGARVVLVARRSGPLEEAALELRSFGADVLTIAADVAVQSECDAVIAKTVKQLGGLDGLVNNAALHHRGPFNSNSAAELAHMVQVNLSAPIYLSRIAFPHLVATRGFIVNVSSIAGCVPTPGSAVYSATKFGLRALSLAVAEEVKDSGVRVTVVSPGPVDTGFIMDHLDGVTDLTMSQPISTASQVATAILACAEDGQFERKLPMQSGLLATFAYLVPSVARLIRPALERKGRRIRQKLLKNQ